MSRTRIDGLSDTDARIAAEAEADLSLLLSLDASPDLSARIRAGLDARTYDRRWKWGWAAVGVASAAAVEMALALRGPADGGGGEIPAGARRPDVVLGVARSGPPVAPLPVPFSLRKTTAPQAMSPRRGEPEVVIDASLADAIQRLSRSARNIPLVERPPEVIPQSLSDASVSGLVVQPLIVPELVLKPAEPKSVSSDTPEHKE
jgi:hypothetical protein